MINVVIGILICGFMLTYDMVDFPHAGFLVWGADFVLFIIFWGFVVVYLVCTGFVGSRKIWFCRLLYFGFVDFI